MVSWWKRFTSSGHMLLFVLKKSTWCTLHRSDFCRLLYYPTIKSRSKIRFCVLNWTCPHPVPVLKSVFSTFMSSSGLPPALLSVGEGLVGILLAWVSPCSGLLQAGMSWNDWMWLVWFRSSSSSSSSSVMLWSLMLSVISLSFCLSCSSSSSTSHCGTGDTLLGVGVCRESWKTKKEIMSECLFKCF